jgi:hypothetical protein
MSIGSPLSPGRTNTLDELVILVVPDRYGIAYGRQSAVRQGLQGKARGRGQACAADNSHCDHPRIFIAMPICLTFNAGIRRAFPSPQMRAKACSRDGDDGNND